MFELYSHRPKRPTEEFLKRVGIYHLPDDIDITFFDGVGTNAGYGVNNLKPSHYTIHKVDTYGHPLSIRKVHAHEMSGRNKFQIWNDLKHTLVRHFNALPWPDNDIEKLMPHEGLLQRAGVRTPLPRNLKVWIEVRGDMPYLIIRRAHSRKETVVELRETRQHNEQVVMHKIREKMSDFGALIQPLAQVG